MDNPAKLCSQGDDAPCRQFVFRPTLEPKHALTHSLTRSPSLVEIQVDAVHRDEAHHVLYLLAPGVEIERS